MESVLIMCFGILVGRLFFSEKLKKPNEIFQVVCTVLLIFSMGALLGSDRELISKISTMGAESFLLFLIPSVLSVALVYLLSKWFLEKK